jgi:hypothetical protein
MLSTGTSQNEHLVTTIPNHTRGAGLTAATWHDAGICTSPGQLRLSCLPTPMSLSVLPFSFPLWMSHVPCDTFAFALPSGLIHQPRPVLPPPRLLSSTSETPASAHPQVTALWAACTTNHASSLALSWHLPNFSLSHLCFNLKSYICTWFCITHTQILWKSIKRRVKAASARSQLPAQTLSPEPRAALFLPLILSLPFVTLNNMLPPLSYRLHTVSGLLL